MQGLAIVYLMSMLCFIMLAPRFVQFWFGVGFALVGLMLSISAIIDRAL